MTDPIIESTISNQIPGQFPEYYRNEGPIFVAFLTAYFKWMESSGQALYHARRIPNYKDIDTTVDDFVVHFRNKYLPNIQLETNSDVRQLVKHSLDLYRSRGTERAVDLLFRLVFGVGASVYLPSDDMFRLSSGRWVAPQYIELNLMENHQRFIGKQIQGTLSKSMAFVERYVRKGSAGRIVDVLYLSNLTGNFWAGEQINTTANPLPIVTCPFILGSLSDLIVKDGGSGFAVGDVVDLDTNLKKRGKARVTGTQTAGGKITFNINDGGFGYTSNTQVLVSGTVMDIDGLWPSGSSHYFKLFDNIFQPLASVNFVNANNNFIPGTNVYTYYANNSLKGQGLIGNVVSSNSSAGVLVLSITSGNLNSDAIYTYSNAVAANLAASNGYTDISASANIISESANVTLVVSGATGKYRVGEEIYQANSQGIRANGFISTITSATPNLILNITSQSGSFSNSDPIVGRISNTTSYAQNATVRVGVITVNNTFLANLPISLPTPGTVRVVSSGVGATFSVIPGSLAYQETVNLNTDLLSNYTTVKLNANSYGLPANTSANLSANVASSLISVPYTIGKIASITSVSPGNNYQTAPLVRVYEPVVTSYDRQDLRLDVVGSTISFGPGELVTQSSTGARGLVQSANSTVINLQRLNLFKEFVPTTDTNSKIVGNQTGAVANVVYINSQNFIPGADIDQVYAGISAKIQTSTTTANGIITSVQVVDSGFGHIDGETLALRKPGATTATVRSVVQRQGVKEGFYLNDEGFASSDKKLYDGDFYQEFSYEIRSSVPFDQYRDMLKDVLHVAGTKAFGAVYLTNGANLVTSTIESAIIAANTPDNDVMSTIFGPMGGYYATSGDPLFVSYGLLGGYNYN